MSKKKEQGENEEKPKTKLQTETNKPKGELTYWEKIGIVANVIIALIALVGIKMAFDQNKETAELIYHAKNAFMAQATPLIKFERYQWIAEAAEVSCEKPVRGMNVYYRNVSGIPVQLEAQGIKIFLDNEELPMSKPLLPISGGAILAPGEATAQMVEGEKMREIYPKLRGPYSEPHTSFELSLTYKSVITGESYKYQVKIELLEDCSIPEQNMYQTEYENIEKMEAEK